MRARLHQLVRLFRVCQREFRMHSRPNRTACNRRPQLRQLGAKPSKSLAPGLVDGAYETDELLFVVEAESPVMPRTNANDWTS